MNWSTLTPRSKFFATSNPILEFKSNPKNGAGACSCCCRVCNGAGYAAAGTRRPTKRPFGLSGNHNGGAVCIYLPSYEGHTGLSPQRLLAIWCCRGESHQRIRQIGGQANAFTHHCHISRTVRHELHLGRSCLCTKMCIPADMRNERVHQPWSPSRTNRAWHRKWWTPTARLQRRC
jgi:hypothetical protein